MKIAMNHISYIEISESALQKNIRFLKKQIGKKVKLSSVVKGNAYGHGIEVFVPLAEKCGIRHFSVFNANEALWVLNSRTQESKIMIMGAIDNEDLEWAIENKISFYIFGLDRLEASNKASQKVGIPARIHLELETGLNRMGLSGEPLEKAVNLIKNYPGSFVVEGVCTHYAGAESVNNYHRIQNQIKSYNEQVEWLKKQGIKIGLRHTACSAAALTYPETIMDMVRFGIAQYGYWPSQETQMHYYLQKGIEQKQKVVDPLKRVIKWKSHIINIKEVKPGEFIGYGTSYMTTRTQKIASVPVGYYHGFARNLSNLGRVLVGGKRAPVVGLVNMNVMMINVTNIPSINIGDEVVIIGRQNKLQISVASFSDMSNFLNYEVLVSLSADIPRIVVE